MVQCIRGHASEPKGHEFESNSCHLVWEYGRRHGRRYIQVRPVRPKISHLISIMLGALLVLVPVLTLCHHKVINKRPRKLISLLHEMIKNIEVK